MSRPLVCTPLLSEYLALHGRVPSATVMRTGMGRARSLASLRRVTPAGSAILVAGLGGGLHEGLRTGDVVVASEVRGPLGSVVTTPSSSVVADALRRRGLTVREGPVVSSLRVERGPSLASLARTGALAVDMESFYLVSSALSDFAVVRVIVDTIDAPLLRPGTALRGIRALRSLRAAAPAIEAWASYVVDQHHSHPKTKEVI